MIDFDWKQIYIERVNKTYLSLSASMIPVNTSVKRPKTRNLWLGQRLLCCSYTS